MRTKTNNTKRASVVKPPWKKLMNIAPLSGVASVNRSG